AKITGMKEHDHSDRSDVDFGLGSWITATEAMSILDHRAHAHESTPDASHAHGHKPEHVPSPSSPNEAIVWNEVMLQAIAASGSGPPFATRAMAIESLAVFNAVNAIEGTPGYHSSLTAPHGASAAAAAAKAAHDVLVNIFPSQSAKFDTQLASSLGAIADGKSETDGIAVGAQAAASMIALRAN